MTAAPTPPYLSAICLAASVLFWINKPSAWACSPHGACTLGSGLIR
jgi:hypothetical protein